MSLRDDFTKIHQYSRNPYPRYINKKMDIDFKVMESQLYYNYPVYTEIRVDLKNFKMPREMARLFYENFIW